MKRIFIGLILLSVVLTSACTSSNAQYQTTVSSSALSQEQHSIGLRQGQIPPDFSITTIDGKQYRLSQFKENNKPILLYFWASWCPYCSKDFDIVKNIYPKYSNKVTFLAIDLDLGEDKDLISKYKTRKDLLGIDFAEGNTNVLSDYGITHTTTKYAIGKNGLILYKGSGVFNEQQWKILLDGMTNS